MGCDAGLSSNIGVGLIVFKGTTSVTCDWVIDNT